MDIADEGYIGSSSSSSHKLTYFSLMEKVGNNGCYQWIIYSILALSWLLMGICSYSLAFLFLEPGFDCSSLGVSEINCQDFVCSHFNDEVRQQYVAKQQINSLVTQFGSSGCEGTYFISVLKALAFFGMTISPLVANCFISHMSERKIFFIHMIIMLGGSLLLVFSSSLALASISLFLIGYGLSIPSCYIISIVTEVTEPNLSKKFIATINGPEIIGGMLISYAYGQIKEWRAVSIYFILIPTIILLIITILFLEDTPYSLLKSKSARQITDSLNRIGKINKGEDNIISQREIQEFLQEQNKIQKVKEHTDPLDLFRYPSLRVKSIALLTYIFLISTAYFAHSMNIDKIGFNPTLNQFLMNIAQLLHVPFLLLLSTTIKRRTTGFVTMSISFVLTLAVSFLVVPSNCEFCVQVYIQMGLILVSRCFILFQFTLGIMNYSQFFPVCIRTIALGSQAILSTFGDGVSTIIFSDVSQMGINPFLLSAILFFILIIVFIWIPQTLDYDPGQQIMEVVEEKNKLEE